MAATLTVNGAAHELDADTARSLLSVLRDDLQLTGGKVRLRRGSVRGLHRAATVQRLRSLPMVPQGWKA